MGFDYNHRLSRRHLQEAFITIRKLHIRGYRYLLNFLIYNNIDMPSLEYLKLAHFAFIGLRYIRKVCEKTRATLSALHIGCGTFCYSDNEYGGPFVDGEVIDKEIPNLSML
jgi:hypothetical protein